MAARLVDPAHGGAAAGMVPNVLIVSGFPWYTSELAIHRYLIDIYPNAAPLTTRLYTNPTNGASRGHCFVEYHLPPAQGNSSSAGYNMNSMAGGAHVGSSGALGSLYTLGDGTSASSQMNANNISNDGGGEEDADAHLPRVLREVKRRIEEHPYECIFLKVHAYVLTSQRWSRAGRLPELPTDPPVSRWRVRGGVLAGYGDEGFAVRCGAELGLPNTLTVEGHEKLERLRKRMRTASARRVSGHLQAE